MTSTPRRSADQDRLDIVIRAVLAAVHAGRDGRLRVEHDVVLEPG